MDIVLIQGLWLTASVWDEVAERLRVRGHRPVLVDLPGQGDGNTEATLADQTAAVLAAVDASNGTVLVVGHSAAATLAWLAVDARPEKVAQVAFIGGFPSPDGSRYADFFPIADQVMPFPGWSAFDGPDSADLDGPTRARLLAEMVPVPEGVARATVTLTDERRYRVPALLVCPEFTPADARAWIAGGDVPELARAQRLTFADIDSGHWPMVTRAAALADLLVGD